MKLTMLWRIAFFLGCIFAAGFFFSNVSTLSVDTDLKDLSPRISSKPEISQAIDSLSENASKRIVILVTAEDESQLEAAVAEINAHVLSNKDLRQDSQDQLEPQIVKLLSPHRFNFLTDKQVELLTHKTVDELVDLEQRKLYRLGEGPRLLPFDEDPLGWFSEYILEVFSGLQLPEPPDTDQLPYFSVVSLMINDSIDTMSKQEALLTQLESLKKRLESTFSIEIKHSGLFFFAIDAAKKSKQDIEKIAIGSMLGVLLLMLFVFRSMAPLLVSFVSILVGVGFATAVTYSVFGKIHVLTIVFGASLIGIVIDYSLHYFFHQFSRLSHKASSVLDKSPSNDKLTRAMMLSVITSLIGFSALAFSDLHSLKKVAVFSCSGLLMAWLTVMSLGNLVSSKPFKNTEGPLGVFVLMLQRVLAIRPKLMLSVGGLTAAACAVYVLLGSVVTNDDPRLFFKASPQRIEQERYVRQYTNSFEANRYFFVSGNSVSKVYEELSRFHKATENTSNNKLFSILNILPSPQAQEESYVLQQKLYGEKTVVEQLLKRLGAAESSAVNASSDYNSAKYQTVLPKKIQDELPQLPPLWSELNDKFHAYIFVGNSAHLESLIHLASGFNNIQYIDVIELTREALQQQRRSASTLLIAAYFLVALLMFLYYRKFSAIFLLVIPISATMFTLCLLSLIGQAVTIFHIMALFLVLGLGMDYVIFANEMRDYDSITMQAILLSAITTLMSFGFLSVSSMPVVQAFGSTLLIGNTVNLLATIFIFKNNNSERMKTL